MAPGPRRRGPRSDRGPVHRPRPPPAPRRGTVLRLPHPRPLRPRTHPSRPRQPGAPMSDAGPTSLPEILDALARLSPETGRMLCLTTGLGGMTSIEGAIDAEGRQDQPVSSLFQRASICGAVAAEARPDANAALFAPCFGVLVRTPGDDLPVPGRLVPALQDADLRLPGQPLLLADPRLPLRPRPRRRRHPPPGPSARRPGRHRPCPAARHLRPLDDGRRPRRSAPGRPCHPRGHPLPLAPGDPGRDALTRPPRPEGDD